MTDLVDSTGTTQRVGEVAAAELWAAHDRLARSLLQAWRGQEIDKSDGFLLVFGQAADAAGFALAYHQALASLPVPVCARAAIHVAAIVLRANSAVDIGRGAKPVEVESWLAKALVARLMSLAQGGQTLLSAEAAAALAASGLHWRGHGHWRLQGLGDPLELFELGDEHSPFVPPPDGAKAYRVVERGGLWLPRRELRHTLPAERDAFVGRGSSLRELADLLQTGTRLVSVLGIGGIGKTRLALRFGWQWLGDYPGGVWFCDLSAAQGPDGIFYAVAQGLELPLDRSEPVAQIGRALAGRGACLVILDNFEQLIAHAEATVGCWLQLAPEARFIVTSRELLGIAGEHGFALVPLPADDAVALFRRRADAGLRTGRPDAAADASAIAPLVDMLDGLPLAIELAAARVRVMSPSMLLGRMSERFKLLAAPGRRVKRQATLRATLDWSWDLLSHGDRSALAQLSVFEGGFSLTDAEAVLDLQVAADARWVPDIVQSLLEKSMLRATRGDRFDLLRSVQEYAAEHMATAGRFDGSGPALLRGVQARHWAYFAALDEHAAVADGCASADNLVVACRRASAAGAAGAAAQALTGVWAVLRRTGPFKLALELGQGVLALPALMPEARSMVEHVLGVAHELLGHGESARTCLEAALALARQADDAAGEAKACCALGEHLYKRGHSDSARQHLLRARQLADRPGLEALQCTALNALGTLEMRLGHDDAARTAYEAALALARGLGDDSRIGGLLGNLAILANAAGQDELAQAQYEQALELSLRIQDRRWEGNIRCNLGLLHQERGQSAAAEVHFQRALAIARELGLALLEATVLCNLGIVCESRGQLPEACALHAQAAALALRLGDRRAEGQFRGYLGASLAQCGRSVEAFSALSAGEAALRDVADQASLALLLCQRAVAEHLAGHPALAAATLDAVRQHPQAAQSGDIQRALAQAQQALQLR